ncbi:hypothetical protein BV22DRAFT_1192926 [Leucogyrophana mollusca]|uniref:Uncharacterized protein n=1 Tax=Leucogyrophana mollusca TaxID=85980 RepID=A0ACB8BU42_9AGAM|nr:hypothetical protein BV22DRAFT_1192926 [Leucogyrophana mollusca]
MFKFIRRVSTSLLPRPDRPWRDDATSNAPTIGRKRRFSLTDRDDEDEPASSGAKRAKGESMEVENASLSAEESASQKEGEDVKSVTRGVEEVELDDSKKDSESMLQPEGIPLPASPRATPQPEAQSPETNADGEVPAQDESKSQEDGDSDSVASSSGNVEDVGDAEAKDAVATADTSAEPTLEDPLPEDDSRPAVAPVATASDDNSNPQPEE